MKRKQDRASYSHRSLAGIRINMRQLIFMYLFVFTLSSYGQDALEWNKDRKLNWDDFKGISKDTCFAAVTYCGISFDIEKVNFWTGRAKYDVKSEFIPDSSWYHSDKIDSMVLQHEQLHFNISELYARKLRKKLADKTILPQDAEKTYDKVYQEYYLFQTKYEQETEFGTNKNYQLQWENEIKIKLEELNDYER